MPALPVFKILAVCLTDARTSCTHIQTKEQLWLFSRFESSGLLCSIFPKNQHKTGTWDLQIVAIATCSMQWHTDLRRACWVSPSLLRCQPKTAASSKASAKPWPDALYQKPWVCKLWKQQRGPGVFLDLWNRSLQDWMMPQPYEFHCQAKSDTALCPVLQSQPWSNSSVAYMLVHWIASRTVLPISPDAFGSWNIPR